MSSTTSANNSEYAVLVPIVTTEDGEALLMEVRSEKVRQPGEICFPGGRIEPGETPAETAVRETCEELGLCPDVITVEGEPGLEMMSDGRKIWTIRARLGISDLGDIKLSEDEVSEVFLLPVEWLRDTPPRSFDLGRLSDEELPEKLAEYLTHYSGYRIAGKTDYWEYDGHGIWGLTARIIRIKLYHRYT